MDKKGDVWISAVLYFGLGMVILTIILSAGIPVINKLRDKNVIIQTKEIMQVLDKTVLNVASEGAGSQRTLSVDITKGQMTLLKENDKIEWKFRSNAAISEPCEEETCSEIKEGNLYIETRKTETKGDYDIIIYLDYSTRDINLESKTPGDTIITGSNQLSVQNKPCSPNETCPAKVRVMFEIL